MIVKYEFKRLKKSTDWDRLASVLGGKQLPIVESIIQHLKNIQTNSYAVESLYIDRDFSSDYRRFYAQTFRNYDRHCKRVHFFAEDVKLILNKKKNWAARVNDLNQTSERSYLGFCVVRPLPTAPIGRTILYNDGPKAEELESVITTRATYTVHLLGAELKVVGAAFMQQELSGRCVCPGSYLDRRSAHASTLWLWMVFCSRHH